MTILTKASLPFYCGLFFFMILGLVKSRAEEFYPIVDVQMGYLLGASIKDKWIDGEKTAKLLKAGTSFRIYNLRKEVGTAKGGEPESAGEVCPETRAVPLSPPFKQGTIALAAPWNALPRVPRVIDKFEPKYNKAVNDFLQSQGLAKPKAKIDQILQVDLEGDGEKETLVSATDYFTEGDRVPTGASAGSYSIIVLCRAVKDGITTKLIAGEIYPESKTFNAPSRYRTIAVLDLNGDGRLEVIVHAFYYEGDWTTVYQCDSQKIEEVLSAGCGV